MPVFPFQLPSSDFIANLLHDFNVASEAVNRLLEQYKHGNIPGLISALAVPAQDLEDAINQLYESRWLNTSTGAQLDNMGSILGFPRNGLTDDQYRVFLLAQSLSLRSSGGYEELYSIFALFLPSGTTMALIDRFPASFNFILTGPAITPFYANIYAQILRNSRAAGVGGQLIWSPRPIGGTFRFDTSGQGWDQGHLAEATP